MSLQALQSSTPGGVFKGLAVGKLLTTLILQKKQPKKGHKPLAAQGQKSHNQNELERMEQMQAYYKHSQVLAKNS